eukprot:1187420-Pleurochrysis_carterae.AAC.1
MQGTYTRKAGSQKNGRTKPSTPRGQTSTTAGKCYFEACNLQPTGICLVQCPWLMPQDFPRRHCVLQQRKEAGLDKKEGSWDTTGQAEKGFPLAMLASTTHQPDDMTNGHCLQQPRVRVQHIKRKRSCMAASNPCTSTCSFLSCVDGQAFQAMVDPTNFKQVMRDVDSPSNGSKPVKLKSTTTSATAPGPLSRATPCLLQQTFPSVGRTAGGPSTEPGRRGLRSEAWGLHRIRSLTSPRHSLVRALGYAEDTHT